MATAVFILLLTSLVGAYHYGTQATALAGSRARAVMLAEEGLEATLNLRDGGFNDLAAGDHGLLVSGNVWTYAGVSDTIDGFTRTVSIGTIDSFRKIATSTVTWSQTGGRTGQVSLVTRLTNYLQTVSSWATPVQAGTLNLAGTEDGVKIQVQGNYVYIVRNDGTPDFVIVDVASSSNPVLVGSLSLTGIPTNIFVSGNYAYVSSQDDSQELQIINISSSTAPTVTGTFNAAGTNNANGVYVVGTTVYLVRATAATDEFVIINASTPASPTSVGTLDLGATGYEVWVSGNYAYIASGANSSELQVVDITTPASPTIAGAGYDAGGNTDALSISGQGSTIFVGRATNNLIIDITTPTAPTLISTFAGAGVVNDIALNFGSANTFIYFCTQSSSFEFELFDITVPATPVSVGAINMTQMNGIAYSTTSDRAYLVAADDAAELYIITPQ